MLDTKKEFLTIIDKLENEDNRDIINISNIFKFGINLIKNSRELREEILDFSNIYQFHIEDVEYDFWLKIDEESMLFKKGTNDKSNVEIFLKMDTFKQIIMKNLLMTKNNKNNDYEFIVSDAYMKGLIKIRGNLTQAIKFKNLILLICKYLKAIIEKNKQN